MIRSIVIDDEAHNRSVLISMLEIHCRNIKIIGQAGSADEAFRLINELKPHLIFLDIKMPGKSGFDLLKMFEVINFEVIFVSAFNEYAIHAFEFNALGYILKPIDYIKLIKTVKKATLKIKEPANDNALLHFVKTLDEKSDLINKFSVHHNGKVVFLNVSDVTSIESQSDYCYIYLSDTTRYSSSKNLKLFDDLLCNTENFIRINKSIILNTHYIKSYSKGDPCIIELTKGRTFEVSRRKKTEILGKLKYLPGS